MPNESQSKKMYEATTTALFADEGRFRTMGTLQGANGRDYVVVGTPFVYPDSDHMMFYVEQRHDGRPGYRLTDMATTVGHHEILNYLGDDGLMSAVQSERFRQVIAKYGAWVEDIGFDDGELHMTVAADQLGFGVAHFAQIQVRLSAILMIDD